MANRESDLVEATNQFDDVAGDITYVSRADWEGTMPKKRQRIRLHLRKYSKHYKIQRLRQIRTQRILYSKNTD